MMKSQIRLIFLFSFLMVSSHCQKNELNNHCDPRSDTYSNLFVLKAILGDDDFRCSDPVELNRLLSFGFFGASNGLNKDYNARISGSTVSVSLPYAIVSSAKPYFNTFGTGVFFNEELVVSNNTVYDFSTPTKIDVQSIDGSKRTYTLIINKLFPVADTGQISCWDQAGTNQICSGTGKDGSYTDIPNPNGFMAPSSSELYPNDFITQNTLTGLVWKTCSEGATGTGCTGNAATLQNWSNSNTLCSNLNGVNGGMGYAGRKKWRLPTIQELLSIVNFQNTSPTTNLSFFPQTIGSGYWSQTVSNAVPGNNHAINFLNASLGNFPIATNGHARCVSGDLPPIENSFSESDSFTVLDNTTGLIWQKCSAGLSNSDCQLGSATPSLWENAITICENLSTSNKKWRLPNVTELQSLVSYSKAGTPFISNFFPNTQSTQYWTSTSNQSNAVNAFLTYFNTGDMSNLPKANTRPVRCVTND
ncbi:MAG: DUF1566 domain-containing protein [Leptospira sp.]|nr:DUF1566 domain-containing protein [Leptospira sp.]